MGVVHHTPSSSSGLLQLEPADGIVDANYGRRDGRFPGAICCCTWGCLGISAQQHSKGCALNPTVIASSHPLPQLLLLLLLLAAVAFVQAMALRSTEVYGSSLVDPLGRLNTETARTIFEEFDKDSSGVVVPRG